MKVSLAQRPIQIIVISANCKDEITQMILFKLQFLCAKIEFSFTDLILVWYHF